MTPRPPFFFITICAVRKVLSKPIFHPHFDSRHDRPLSVTCCWILEEYVFPSTSNLKDIYHIFLGLFFYSLHKPNSFLFLDISPTTF